MENGIIVLLSTRTTILWELSLVLGKIFVYWSKESGISTAVSTVMQKGYTHQSITVNISKTGMKTVLPWKQESGSMHGLRDMKLIADGYSYVYARIREVHVVPILGKKVLKMECANHACKCVRCHLEKLLVVSENPQYQGWHRLTKLVLIRIGLCVAPSEYGPSNM